MTEQVAVRAGLMRDGAERVYAGAALRHVAMPLGGLGAGQIALGGDGGLRQWQIANQVNHLGFVPDSFFAVRASCIEPPADVLRVLQSRDVVDLPADPTPLVNDDHIPPDQRALLDQAPGVARTAFSGTYPFARIRYDDDALPVDVALEAFSPFVPLDAAASGLPAILFNFTVRNRWPHPVQGCLGATLQNAVGWDGVTPIAGNRCPLYGGNTNRVRHRPGHTSLVMENPALPDDHPGGGQMALTALSDDARPYERWTTPGQFLRFMEGFNPTRHVAGRDPIEPRSYRNGPAIAYGPSPAGTTWNGGLIVPFWLQPGEAATITFVLSWYFSNRYVNLDQFGRPRDYGRSRFWLGDAYTARFADAVEVAEYVIRDRERLESASRAWERVLRDSTLRVGSRKPWRRRAA